MAYGLPAEGTRRLQIGLGLLAVGFCLAAYAVVLILYGRPYWIGWWVVMLVVLAGSFLVGRIVAPVLEWIIAGYRS